MYACVRILSMCVGVNDRNVHVMSTEGLVDVRLLVKVILNPSFVVEKGAMKINRCIEDNGDDRRR